MLFNKKPKCPVTNDDHDFINECFEWIGESFGKEIFLNKIITPKLFQFTGIREDVYPILKLACQRMSIAEKRIKVQFYNERTVGEFAQDMLSQYAENTQLTTGQYKQYDTNEVEIWIEESTLQRPNSLVATIAHELSHFKLLYEQRIEENDELLTDLLTVVFGFGIFGANSSIAKMQTWSTGTGSGWNVDGGEGYLHYKLWAFALAKFVSLGKDRELPWLDSLENEVRKEFNKSLKYLDYVSR